MNIYNVEKCTFKFLYNVTFDHQLYQYISSRFNDTISLYQYISSRFNDTILVKIFTVISIYKLSI